jgi:hypothetical protein
VQHRSAPEATDHLVEDCDRISDAVQGVVEETDVGNAVGKRHRLRLGEVELHVGEPAAPRRSASSLEHRRGVVHADVANWPGWVQPPEGEAGAAGDVEDGRTSGQVARGAEALVHGSEVRGPDGSADHPRQGRTLDVETVEAAEPSGVGIAIVHVLEDRD